MGLGFPVVISPKIHSNIIIRALVREVVAQLGLRCTLSMAIQADRLLVESAGTSSTTPNSKGTEIAHRKLDPLPVGRAQHEYSLRGLWATV